MPRRREEDQSTLKKLWIRITPLIQIGGWLTIAVPVVLGLGSLINQAQAFGERLTTVETAQASYTAKQDLIITKIDTILYFVRRK